MAFRYCMCPTLAYPQPRQHVCPLGTGTKQNPFHPACIHHLACIHIHVIRLFHQLPSIDSRSRSPGSATSYSKTTEGRISVWDILETPTLSPPSDLCWACWGKPDLQWHHCRNAAAVEPGHSKLTSLLFCQDLLCRLPFLWHLFHIHGEQCMHGFCFKGILLGF